MKVILTGSTGFIGREVLEQCLQNSRITSIIALSRRELSPALAHNPKLKVLIMENFLSYPPFRESFASQQGLGNNAKFRFVYLSGGGAERDQTKSLWFMQDYRRIRGQVENELMSFTQENRESFESYILRSGMVLSKENG